MSINIANSIHQHQSSTCDSFRPEIIEINTQNPLQKHVLEQLVSHLQSKSASVRAVATRLASEVERVCNKSNRIQKSGEIRNWQLSLGSHRINKCITYYELGSRQGRVELHSNLSVMIYRHIAPAQKQLGFSARYNLIEDFLQEFYTESLRAFRRENEVPENYQPRTRIELAEYMAFTEQYAKRRINLPNGYSQQLIVLRAQSFARRQPNETAVDIEQAIEFSKEDSQTRQYSAAMQQIRSSMVDEATDPWEGASRDRVIHELFKYLEANGHRDCADYLVLKLQDMSAADIDEILGLTPRERDYLQQRFKYHVEKFARTSHWKIVHQWLGADIDQKLGLSADKWAEFYGNLSEEQQLLWQLKQEKKSDKEIAKALGCTPKKAQKRWTKLLELAAQIRNSK